MNHSQKKHLKKLDKLQQMRKLKAKQIAEVAEEAKEGKTISKFIEANISMFIEVNGYSWYMINVVALFETHCR